MANQQRPPLRTRGSTTYSKAALAALWIQAGGPASEANLAASVALAESGGRADAIGHNTNGSIDRGLWQINSIHGDQSTLDPLANARAAVAISSHGANWKPWVAFTTGRFRQFLTAGTSSSTPGTSAPSTRDASSSDLLNDDRRSGLAKAALTVAVVAAGAGAMWIASKQLHPAGSPA